MRFVGRWTVAAAVLLLAGVANAGLREPQVPIGGPDLQNFFNAQGQAIDVKKDQVNAQHFSLPPGSQFQVNMVLLSQSLSFGLYNYAAPSPFLYLISSPSATAGWFEVAAFRTSPTRLVVNLFDNSSSFVGATTYTAGPPDVSGFSFYSNGPNGTFYGEDARNGGGNPRILVFNGTGTRSGSLWFAVDATSLPSEFTKPSQFTSVIYLVTLPASAVPTSTTTWTRVKKLFQ